MTNITVSAVRTFFSLEMPLTDSVSFFAIFLPVFAQINGF